MQRSHYHSGSGCGRGTRIPNATDRLGVDWPEEIRRLRRVKSLKQFALAETLGVDQATVSRWERGKSVPELGMQRRLRGLIWRVVDDEVLIRHAVTVAASSVFLSNSERIMQAVSVSYSRAHGMRQDQMPGQCNVGRFGPEGEAIIGRLRERGFYRGDVASVSALCRAPSLSGHRPPVPVRIVFTPVRVGSQILLHGDRIELSEDQFAVELTRGRLRFVMMDELVG